MSSDEKIPFYRSKWFKMLKFFSAVIFCCGAFVFVLITDDSFFGKTIAWFGLAFFGGGSMAVIGKVLWLKHKGLSLVTITDEELVINGKAICWENIESFVGSRYGLLVMTNNIKERLAKANLLERLSIKFNQKTCGTDITISEDWIDGTFQQFVDRCKPYLEQHHPASSLKFYK